MKDITVFWMVLALIIGTIMTACNAVPAAPDGESGSEALPPVAVVRAREALANDLNIGVESITIENYERAEWTDSCLGLGGPAESCLAAIHPGWRVTLSVDGGDVFEVRTDELGEIIRIKK
jgi:hypothetical protein